MPLAIRPKRDTGSARRLRALAALATLATLSAIASPAQSPSTQTLARPGRRLLAPVNNSSRAVLHGNTHPLATAANDHGVVPDSTPLQRMMLTLAPSDAQQTALETLLVNQQDASSPQFHHWLTPAEFGAQFGVADADIQTITSWLTSQGFTIDSVSNSRTVIEFSGTAGMVKQAFATEIHQYLVDGTLYTANAADPSIPSALTPVVRGIVSLYNFPRHHHHQIVGDFRRDHATGKVTQLSGTTPLAPSASADSTRPHPEFTYPSGGSGGNVYAVAPFDFATIYNVKALWNSGIDGTGQSIAIVGQTDINIADVHNFRAIFGLPTNDPQIILNGTDPGVVSADEGEADIDVQWSGAVAPHATIKYVVSATTKTSEGVDLSAEYIINNNLAPVMSESYGECELGLGTAGNAFFNSLWQQAAAQGISVFVSSGDSGSAGCDNPDGTTAAQFGVAVNGISSTPYNTAVGGTDFLGSLVAPGTYWSSTDDPTTHASALGYIPESPWNSTCANPLLQTSLIWNQPSSAAACQYAFTHGFNLFTPVGGTGGVSACTTPSGGTPAFCSGGYAKPSWQTGLGVPGDGKRDVPDISLFASSGFLGSFYVYCQQDANSDGQPCNINSTYTDFRGVGGTSVSSPAFAGIMALVVQKTGSAQGVANNVLYSLFSKQVAGGASCSTGLNTSGNTLFAPSPSCVFNDLTFGSIAVPCVSGSPNCTTPAGDHYGILTANGSDAYLTTAGYDLASGLGSVNAFNLVNAWNGVSLTPTTTTLAVDQVNLSTSAETLVSSAPYGAKIDLATTVAPTSGSGTPTGTVTLSDSSSSVGTATLSSGLAHLYTTTLAAGAHSLSASYGGDSTFGTSSTASASALTITKAASANTLTTSSTSITAGSSITLTSTLVGANATSVGNFGAAPTGTVGFYSGGTSGTLLGTASITATGTNSSGYTTGTATLSTTSLPSSGSSTVDSITAVYSGDTNYTGSTSNAVSVTVTGATGSLASLALSLPQAGPYSVSSLITINALVSAVSSGPTPTGSVSYTLNGATGSSATLSSGAASFSIAGYKLLKYPVAATYSGDTTYTSATQSLQVGPFTQTIIFRGLANLPFSSGATVALTARSTSGLPVSYTVSGPATLSGSTLTLTGTGTVNVTASQSGNSTFAAATSVTRSFASQ